MSFAAHRTIDTWQEPAPGAPEVPGAMRRGGEESHGRDGYRIGPTRFAAVPAALQRPRVARAPSSLTRTLCMAQLFG